MPERVDDVLITGSAQGLGLSMAEAFLDAGHRVMLSDLAEDTLEAAGRALHKKFGDAVTWAPADVTDDESVARLSLIS